MKKNLFKITIITSALIGIISIQAPDVISLNTTQCENSLDKLPRFPDALDDVI